VIRVADRLLSSLLVNALSDNAGPSVDRVADFMGRHHETNNYDLQYLKLTMLL
jgi:hypothetical protein